jgi:hypothetical protein
MFVPVAMVCSTYDVNIWQRNFNLHEFVLEMLFVDYLECSPTRNIHVLYVRNLLTSVSYMG